MAERREIKKCPTCQMEKERSYVYPVGGSGSLFAVMLPPTEVFWDEDGQEHHHNPNINRRSFVCSRQHTWKEESRIPCPAGDYPKWDFINEENPQEGIRMATNG